MTLMLIENHFQEYRNGQPFIFPFHILLIPVTYLFRSERNQRRKCNTPVLNQTKRTDRDKLFSTLCDRYSRSQIASEVRNSSRDYDCTQRRDATFAEAVAIQRHNAETRKLKSLQRNELMSNSIEQMQELQKLHELQEDQ